MNAIIRLFNYRFFVKEFLVVLFGYLLMEQILAWLFIPSSSFVQPFQKLSGFLIFGLMIYLFPRLRRVERVYVIIFCLFMVKLVLESMYKYDTFFQQLTMYYVLFPVLYTFFVKHINRTFDLDLLEFMAKFYLFIYVVFMALYGRNFSFSLQSFNMEDLGVFSGDGRIIHASSVFMMILPFLWYLDKFINTRKLKHFGLLLFCIVIILIHQHRSVWSGAIFSLLIYFGISIRTNKKSIPKIWGLVIGAFVLFLFSYFFMSTLFPDMVDFFGQRFSEIFNPGQQESTGRFRVEQREVYFKLFLQRPLFGWSFEGFEMSNPLVDWWPEKTGQHFHEGFMEILFYHGIIGFVFKYSILFYLAIRAFSKNLNNQTIILLSFCMAGLVFSLSYVPQIVFWGHVGLCLYYLEKDDLKQQQLEITEIPDTIKNSPKISRYDLAEHTFES